MEVTEEFIVFWCVAPYSEIESGRYFEKKGLPSFLRRYSDAGTTRVKFLADCTASFPEGKG